MLHTGLPYQNFLSKIAPHIGVSCAHPALGQEHAAHDCDLPKAYDAKHYYCVGTTKTPALEQISQNLIMSMLSCITAKHWQVMVQAFGMSSTFLAGVA